MVFLVYLVERANDFVGSREAFTPTLCREVSACGVSAKSNRVHQKFDKFRLVEFFIHCESNGISSRVSVHFITEGVYHQSQIVLLSQ